jgi:hypothetical protein
MFQISRRNSKVGYASSTFSMCSESLASKRYAVRTLQGLIGDAEFYSTEFRLLGEQLAHVDAGADEAVIVCPGAQHLPRTAAEVEHSGPRFQTQRRAENGELFGCDGVVDAVSTFSDVEYSRDVHCGKFPYGRK